MNPATDTKADDTLDEASFKTIAAATFLHPDAQAAEPRVYPCAICCTFFSGFAVLFLVRAVGVLGGPQLQLRV